MPSRDIDLRRQPLLPSASPIGLPIALGGSPATLTDGYVIDRWTGQEGLSPTTRRAYVLEGARLLAWMANLAGGHQSSALPLLMLPHLTEEHVKLYANWLTSDVTDKSALSPAALTHAGFKGQPRRKPLHPRSLVQALALVNALWEHASTDPHSAAFMPPGNPVTRVLHTLRSQAKSAKDKFGRKRSDAEVEGALAKYLNPAAWKWVMQVVNDLASTPRWRGDRARQAKLIVWLAYFQALRIHEIRLLETVDLVAPVNAGGRWRMNVTGKGGSREQMTIYAEVLDALTAFTPDVLATYKAAPRPLVRAVAFQRGPAQDQHADKEAVSLSTLHRIFRHVMEQAARRASEAGEADAAEKLHRATSHWCRHARVSHVLNAGASMRVAQRLARHASANTTRIYDHSDPVDVDDPIEAATRATMSQMR